MATIAAQTGYAAVNGLNLYYETSGAGQPLVLIHGGFGTVEMFPAPLRSALAENRQVIAVELQGHGHTADIDRPLSFEQMADDVAALIAHLGHAQADVCGYSMGGGVALQTAIRHPNVVRRLVVVSAACKRDGWYPEDLAGMSAVNAEAARAWVGSPMHQAYASVAPNPENWTALADKTGQLLREDYDWSADVANIAAPALIAVGDADGIRLPHAVEMFELLGGGKATPPMGNPPASRLAVLPGTTHFSIMSASLATIITPFLDAPMPEAQ